MLVKVVDVNSEVEYFVNKSMVTHTAKVSDNEFGIYILELETPILVSNLDHKKIIS